MPFGGNLYVGDAIVLVKLAYSLYENGYLVARHAPDEFRELLEELRLIKKILFGIQARFRRDGSSEDRLTEQVLDRCHIALHAFQPILQKFMKLASTDHGLWVKRILWAKDQAEINKCREKFQRAAHLLPFVLAPSLREGSEVVGDPSVSDTLVYEQSGQQKPMPPLQLPEAPSAPTQAPKIRRKPVPSRLHERGSTRSDSSVSTDELMLSSGPAAELGIGNQTSSWLWFPASSASISRSEQARRAITFSRPKAQPLGLIENREKHNVDEGVRQRFYDTSASVEPEPDTEAWINIATWWLLKSQKIWGTLMENRPLRPEESNNANPDSWDTNISAYQAWTDLFKCSFIVEDVILRKDLEGTNLENTTRENLKSLSDSIHHELRRRRLSSTSPRCETSDLLKQNLDFLEWMSPIEDPQFVPNCFDNLNSPQRWLTVQLDHAGMERERLLYRTFVNAQLGRKNIRPRKSTTAPYMLLLSCHNGRSEISISLCNLAFTVNLSRRMTWDDVHRLEQSTRADGGLDLEFPNQQAVIKFLDDDDRAAFLHFPKTFFSSLKDREPRPGEILNLREGLSTYKSREAMGSGSTALHNRRMNDSNLACEMSLYDFCPEDTWKTTRRLVISSDPATTQPWCISHWLPLSRIQIQVQAQEVTLIWSDYQQLSEKSNGEYGILHSYVYDADHPNCSVSLVFEDAEAADAFAYCLLHPFDTPFKIDYVDFLGTFGSGSNTQHAQLYHLHDTEEGPKKGRTAIVKIQERPNILQGTEVFFAYRDFDFILECKTRYAIEFPDLEVPEYLSTIQDVAKRPDEEHGHPEYGGVEVINRPARLEFPRKEELFLFVENLMGWKLKFCCKARLVSLDRKASFSKTYRKPIVHIFEKPATVDKPIKMRLAIRCIKDDESYWITASPQSPVIHSSKVVFKSLQIQRGDEIDSKKLEGIDSTSRSQEQSHTEPRWRLVLVFPSSEEAHEFTSQTGHTSKDWRGTGDLLEEH